MKQWGGREIQTEGDSELLCESESELWRDNELMHDSDNELPHDSNNELQHDSDNKLLHDSDSELPRNSDSEDTERWADQARQKGAWWIILTNTALVLTLPGYKDESGSGQSMAVVIQSWVCFATVPEAQ